jgi:hypothetical protein
MTNYKEILRLQSLGINNTRIAEACGCARSTVISTLQYATAKGLKWDSVRDWTEKEVAEKLLPSVAAIQHKVWALNKDVHKTLANPYPRTPAMAAGISDHIWSVEEIIKLTSY